MIRIGLVLLGLSLCLWRFGTATMGAEEIRKEGDVVMFELAPVDPRELFLGDYMRLNYQPDALPPSDVPEQGVAVIVVSDMGIGTFVRLAQPDETVSEGEQLIRYHSGRWPSRHYGGLRYYFQSGTSARFSDAQYGVFRGMPDGRAILSGLADGQGRILLPAGQKNSAPEGATEIEIDEDGT